MQRNTEYTLHYNILQHTLPDNWNIIFPHDTKDNPSNVLYYVRLKNILGHNAQQSTLGDRMVLNGHAMLLLGAICAVASPHTFSSTAKKRIQDPSKDF